MYTLEEFVNLNEKTLGNFVRSTPDSFIEIPFKTYQDRRIQRGDVLKFSGQYDIIADSYIGSHRGTPLIYRDVWNNTALDAKILRLKRLSCSEELKIIRSKLEEYLKL